ncbi:MAG TPA: sensor histidine kinase [Polyangia bacterium]|jgi:signal transduction histidine kinase|nr:sensor histidine kinase [Polyangia bacterium]
MEDGSRKLSPAARLTALESWREKVLRGMLTVGAIVAPPIVVISLVLRSGPQPWPKIVAFIGAALAFPVLRFAPKLSVTTRATLAIGLSYLTGVVALTTFGFSSGPGIVLAGTSILAVVFLGRVRGFIFIALSVAAFFVIGTLAARGRLAISGAELDPTQMRNWTRMGTTFAFLALLLTTAIDFVIRRVEESMRDTAEALTDLRAAYARLALLHERFDAAKEEERRFIAHELHDELGQMLTVVKLQLTARRDGGPAGETVGLVDGMIDRVRRISTDLRPPLFDEVGLFPALRAHVDAQSALSGVAIDLDANEADGGRLDSARETACFRVVQEAITNALRHASPQRIQVRVIRRPDTISLSIADDGRGFDTATLAQTSAGHLGVAGMQERVRARGGHFNVSSRPGAGTTVAVEMPTA